jgi:hypothetical protein
MRSPLRIVALTVATAICGLLSSTSPAEQATTQPAAGAAHSAMTPVTVKLLEAGSGEKKPLRYALAKGQEATMTSTGTIEMKTSVGGQEMPQKLPTMTSKMTATVTAISGSGDAAVGISYMGPSAKTPATGSANINNRGIANTFDLTIPADATAALKQQLEGTRQKSTQYFVPFPEEPVGVGAKWQVSQTITQQAMTIEQITVYTLKSRDGDAADMELAVTQSAAEQDIESPQMPGMKIHLKSFKSTGSGTAKVSFASLLCASAKFDMNTDMTMIVPQVGEMVQHMVTSMTGTTVKKDDSQVH